MERRGLRKEKGTQHRGHRGEELEKRKGTQHSTGVGRRATPELSPAVSEVRRPLQQQPGAVSVRWTQQTNTNTGKYKCKTNTNTGKYNCKTNPSSTNQAL